MKPDIRFVKDRLHATAGRLSDLAEQLSEKGSELSQDDKRTIRFGLLDWVNYMHEEASLFFARGNFKDYETSRVQVLSTLEWLS